MSLRFRQEEIAVRDLEERDVPVMVRWLSDPRVLDYWEGRDHPFDEQMVRETFLNPEDTDVVCCIAEQNDVPIAYIQFYSDEQELYGYAEELTFFGIDLFIGEPELWGQGIGTRLISGMVKYLFDEFHADILAIDPHVDNARAIRSYEKAGFRKVRILPHHEVHEGEWKDCWLMECWR